MLKCLACLARKWNTLKELKSLPLKWTNHQSLLNTPQKACSIKVAQLGKTGLRPFV